MEFLKVLAVLSPFIVFIVVILVVTRGRDMGHRKSSAEHT